jgi:SAM-dependent methyltransferase
MRALENRQEVFSAFCVPDRGRILKVKKWLERNEYLSSGQDIRVLEIGYARGGLIDNLHEYETVKRYAIDINHRQTENGIIFHKHDCNYGVYDFNGLTFDVVFVGEVIEHIFDDKKFLEDIYEILKPGGILCLTAPNLFFLFNRIVFPFGKVPYFAYAPFHYHFYSKAILSQMVKDSGFDIQYITSSHIFISSRRNRFFGKIFEFLGDILINFGAHIILFARKPKKNNVIKNT